MDIFYFKSKKHAESSEGERNGESLSQIAFIVRRIPIFVLKFSFSLTECSVALINWKANETS